jgi:hypothetical protein
VVRSTRHSGDDSGETPTESDGGGLLLGRLEAVAVGKLPDAVVVVLRHAKLDRPFETLGRGRELA